MSLLLDILFPPKCVFCDAILPLGSNGVCERCLATLPRASRRERRVKFIKSVSAPLYYEGIVRRSLLMFKFRSYPARGRAFGLLVGEELAARETEFDVLTWAPLHRRRFRKRGYDQAQIIAEAAAARLGTSAVPTLRKLRNATPQSRIKTAEGKRANISGCYEVLDPASVRGKRVLLVDDIITTGSTVSECARMLLLAGAKEVHAAALAIHRDDNG